MAVQFATIAQYRAFQGLPEREPRPSDPDGAAAFDAETFRLNALLQRATIPVRRAVRLSRVRYAPTGLPRDEDVAEVFAQATAAQAVQFDEIGSASGNGADYTSVSLIGVQFSKATSAAKSNAEARVSAEAMDILAAAGLFTTRVAY